MAATRSPLARRSSPSPTCPAILKVLLKMGCSTSSPFGKLPPHPQILAAKLSSSRDARHLPHVTRVPNPYEIPERPPPPSDILPAVHPALPSPEWRTLFETRCRNFRKNAAQSTTHVHQPAHHKLMPDMKDRDLWWAFLSGRPAAEWDLPKKRHNARKFQRGMRAFADDDDSTMEAPFVGSSREALEMRPTSEDTEASPQLPTPSGTPVPTDLPAEQAPEHAAEAGMPIYKPREPTPSLLRLIDQVGFASAASPILLILFP
jgi:hypothetical protein